MALRSGIVTRQEIPGEDGEWVDLRQLGWKDLDSARRARQTDSFDSLRAMGKDLYQMIQETRSDTSAASEIDPLTMYDLGTVLELGIAAWSYDAPVTPETIATLDPETADWAARQIVGVRESEDDRKNVSGASTSPSLAKVTPPTSG